MEGKILHLILAIPVLLIGITTHASSTTTSATTEFSIDTSRFCFIKVDHGVLVGFVTTALSNVTLAECKLACVRAESKQQFRCRSLMYFATETDCILNEDTRHSRPEFFIINKEETVEYYDHTCTYLKNLKTTTTAAATETTSVKTPMPAPARRQTRTPPGADVEKCFGARKRGKFLGFTFRSYFKRSRLQCMQLCLRNNERLFHKDLRCKSITYFVETRDCFLNNSLASEQHDDYFVQEEWDSAVYFENKCGDS